MESALGLDYLFPSGSRSFILSLTIRITKAFVIPILTRSTEKFAAERNFSGDLNTSRLLILAGLVVSKFKEFYSV